VPKVADHLAVVRPDGTLLSYQPYGKEGLLIADIDITAATGSSLAANLSSLWQRSQGRDLHRSTTFAL
jgi:hypothetical protein